MTDLIGAPADAARLADGARDETHRAEGRPTDAQPPAPSPEGRPTATPTGTLDDHLAAHPLLRPTGYFLGSRLVVWLSACVAGLLSPRLDVVGTFGSIWDGKWYLLIAQHGYPHRLSQEGLGSRWAFFPALPAVIRAVSEVTRLDPAAAAVVCAWVFGLTATLAIWLAVRQQFGRVLADRTALLFAFFPLSCVLSFAYTEGLFLTAAAGCLYALGRRWWITAALLACLAGLTRNTGIVVVLCVLVVAVPAAWRERRLRPLAAAALAPLGLGAFMAYSWAMVGTPIAFITSEKFWQGQHFVWFTTPVHAVITLVAVRAHGLLLVQAALCTAAVAFVYVGIVCMLAMKEKGQHPIPLSWWLYTVGTVALAFSAYFTDSIPRYTMVAFPLLLAIAWKLRSSSRAVLVVAMGAMQAVLTVVFLIGLVHPMSPPLVP